MPGSPLDLEYPVTGDSVYDVLRKFSDNFQTLETDLEAKVSESDILVGGPLSVRDNPIQDVGQVVMSPQVVAPTAEGTLSYANGSWYVADAVGAIRLTDGSGGFNSSGFKGIGGDYGAGDPSEVTYSASAGLYEFTDDPGVYSDGAFEAIKFMRAAGSIAVSAPSGVAGALTLTLPEPPGAGTAALTLTSAGVLAPGAAVTVAQTFADLTATILRRPAADKPVPLAQVQGVTSATIAFTRTYNQIGVTRSGVDNAFLVASPDIEVGQTLNSATVTAGRTGAGTMRLDIYSVTSAGVATPIATTATTVATGTVTLTANVTTPAAMGANEYYVFLVELPASGDSLKSVFFNKQG